MVVCHIESNHLILLRFLVGAAEVISNDVLARRMDDAKREIDRLPFGEMCDGETSVELDA